MGVANEAVQMTASGREALTLVQSVAPALVVLDLMLPDLDGLEVCRRILETSSSRDARSMAIGHSSTGSSHLFVAANHHSGPRRKRPGE